MAALITGHPDLRGLELLGLKWSEDERYGALDALRVSTLTGTRSVHIIAPDGPLRGARGRTRG